jgi:hypothetical protein
MVDSALRVLDQQLADVGPADDAEVLRASARALLGVAYHQEGYEALLVPTSFAVGLTVRHTAFGLEAEIVQLVGTGDSKSEGEEA